MLGDNAFCRAASVAETLKQCAGSVEQLSPARWKFRVSSGLDVSVEARVEEGWLLLSAGLLPGPCQPCVGTLWRWLEENGGLRGGVKFARLPGAKGVLARVELPLDDDEIDLGMRIQQAVLGFRSAAASHNGLSEGCRRGAEKQGETAAGPLWGANAPASNESRNLPDPRASKETGGQPTAQRQVTEEQPSPASLGLRDLCVGAGWECTEQAGGRLVVQLDVPGAFHQAMVHQGAGGRVVLAAALPPCDGKTPQTCLHAVGLLLLRACGVIRMARAAAQVLEARADPRFEVVFDTAPCAPELAHALCALSVACRLCAEEAEVLQSDERIAREYVARWGSEVERDGQG